MDHLHAGRPGVGPIQVDKYSPPISCESYSPLICGSQEQCLSSRFCTADKTSSHTPTFDRLSIKTRLSYRRATAILWKFSKMIGASALSDSLISETKWCSACSTVRSRRNFSSILSSTAYSFKVEKEERQDESQF